MQNTEDRQRGSQLYNPKEEHDACGVGVVARLDAKPQHAVVEQAISALSRMEHRGGAVFNTENADGAGILLPLPHDFIKKEWEPSCGTLPEHYALGHFFLSRQPEVRQKTEEIITTTIKQYGLEPLGWRDTPVNPAVLEKNALACLPVIRQLLVTAENVETIAQPDDFERLLFLARKHLEKAVKEHVTANPADFHVASFSSRSIVYKAMLSGGKLAEFYPDLANRFFAAHFAIFHERFSTNTQPAWRLAQPFHHVAHNGEINTLRCNRANMRMREPVLSSSLFGSAQKNLTPVLDEHGSDSAMLDNAFELLVQSGRSLSHAAMMLLPEPFGDSLIMGDDKRSFYEYHAALMEPWDGPAALVFTDGQKQVGAMLDRNALRPCRYAITQDNLFILASEAGVLDIPAEHIVRRGRLHPRRMLLIDFARKRVITDAECKGRVIYNKQYRHWVKEHGVTLRQLPVPAHAPKEPLTEKELLQQQLLYGYSREDITDIIQPMATNAQEPVASMGADTPLAVLSQKPQLLFSYFKQCFAQVTNPPIDPLREGLVMTLTGFAGKRLNLLEESPEHYDMLRLSNPILFEDDLLRLTASTNPFVKVVTVDALFALPRGGESPADSLESGIKTMLSNAEAALDKGATILLLSDEHAHENRAPIPSLLAVSALHQYLLRQNRRHACSIFINTGEAREVMHIAQLLAFGASAVHPRVAFASVRQLSRQGKSGTNTTEDKALVAYSSAIQKGLLKTFSRLGISTLRSFIGGQVFEPLGLSQQLVDDYFTGLDSRIGGIGLQSIAADTLARHSVAFFQENDAPEALKDDGRHRHRTGGERHLWTPSSVKALHKAVREDNYESYKVYAAETDNQSERPVTLRSLFAFTEGTSIPLDEVESEESIIRRFVGAAMSYGSISPEAHEAIAIAMNRLGAKSNCGEGGEDSSRNIPLSPDMDKRSRVRQIASGRFGVTAEYLVHAEELQIKMAQGAKPGEGGQLPAHKVLPHIAKARHTTPGVTLISPPPHHDIYSIEDLAQLIFDLKRVNPKAAISVKLVAGAGVGTIASGVAKAGADGILISGHDGGTGAAPRSAISHVGLPWELGLAETQAALSANGLRRQIRLQVDGQLHTGRDLVVATMLGAEEYGFGTTLLVALGCCMLRVCHLGTCAVGVAAQDPRLRNKFPGKPEHVERFLHFIARDMREHMARLGFRSIEEMIGRSDRLMQVTLDHKEKASGLDFSRLLAKGEDRAFFTAPRPALKDSILDESMLKALSSGIVNKRPSRFEGTVRNTDRAVGTRIAGEVARLYGEEGLTPGTLEITLNGTAGQSAGAFLIRGVTLRINGEANDYVGKGLSGGTIIVAPVGDSASFDNEQAAVGNVALYGATSGEAFIAGSAGERFAVRNSGATTVVEGVGDHSCEYMTGGTVVVLGTTGYNFAAGMSGGTAYVFDRSELFLTRCNMDNVDLESVWQKEDVSLLHSLLTRHVRLTGSVLAKAILDDWSASLPLFLKVTPIEHHHALERMKKAETRSAESIPATEEVYK